MIAPILGLLILGVAAGLGVAFVVKTTEPGGLLYDDKQPGKAIGVALSAGLALFLFSMIYLDVVNSLFP